MVNKFIIGILRKLTDIIMSIFAIIMFIGIIYGGYFWLNNSYALAQEPRRYEKEYLKYLDSRIWQLEEELRKLREEKANIEGRVPKLTREFLISRSWEFRHGEGGVISHRVRIDPNGTIIGIGHPNESTWGLEDGTLVFYHISGVPSTRFTSIRREQGKIILSGPLLLPGLKPVVIHVLEEL